MEIVNYTTEPAPKETKWKCPTCKTDLHAEQVRRGTLVKLLLGWRFTKRYICYRCRRKYYTTNKVR